MAILDGNNDGIIEKEEIKQNLKKLLSKFDTESVDDMVVVTDQDYLQGREDDPERERLLREVREGEDNEEDDESGGRDGPDNEDDEEADRSPFGGDDEENGEGEEDPRRDREEL